MSDYAKFLLPEGMPAIHAPFWHSIANHRAAIQKCCECETFRFIPREICPKCHSAVAQWTPISGRGEVYTYTVVHRAPTLSYQADAPYVIAHIELEEGVRMIANLVDVSLEEVRIGLAVQIIYKDVSEDLTLFAFMPVVDRVGK